METGRRKLVDEIVQRRRERVVGMGRQKLSRKAGTGRSKRSLSMFIEVWTRPLMIFKKSWDTSETGMAERWCLAETGSSETGPCQKLIVVVVQRRSERVVGMGCHQHTKIAGTGCRKWVVGTSSTFKEGWKEVWNGLSSSMMFKKGRDTSERGLRQTE